MIRSNPSPGSRGFFHTIRSHRGFTLVELTMSIVLIGIGTTLAFPSYRDMIDKRQLTNNAERLAAFVSSVQTISSRTNQVVTVSYSRSNHENWCIGAVIDDTACDCTETVSTASDFCAIDSQKFVMDNGDTNDQELLHSITGDGAYSFDPIRGLFLDLDDSLTMELHSDNRKFKLNLVVSSTGRVILCSDDSEHAIPGYDVC